MKAKNKKNLECRILYIF